jgi:hypothetical protein
MKCYNKVVGGGCMTKRLKESKLSLLQYENLTVRITSITICVIN